MTKLYTGVCPECGQEKKIRHNTKRKICYNCYEVDLRKRNDHAVVTITLDRSEYTKVKEFANINNYTVADTFRMFVTWGLDAGQDEQIARDVPKLRAISNSSNNKQSAV